MPRHRILFIDDNPDLRATLAARLTQAGYEVVAAGSGQEGVPLALEEHFDLVLLDMLMPGQDGIATYQALRAQEATRGLPVILFASTARSTRTSDKLMTIDGHDGSNRRAIAYSDSGTTTC